MSSETETALGTLATQLTALAANLALHTTSQDALVAAEVLKSLPRGVPVGATPFSACNQAAATTDATPVEVRASPGATRMFITQAIVYNKTTAEKAICTINDEDDVIAAVVGTASFDGDVIAANRGVYNFDPPLIIAVSKAVEITPIGTLGDTYLTIVGYDAA